MNSNCSFKLAVAELFLSRLSLQGMVMDYDRKYCNLEPLAAYFFNRIHLSAQHTIALLFCAQAIQRNGQKHARNKCRQDNLCQTNKLCLQLRIAAPLFCRLHLPLKR